MTQGPQTILVVEDDVELRERFYDVLSKDGHAVIAVHSGERALGELKHDRPALILLDTRLPDMSGAQLVEHIRTFDARVPLILLDGQPTNTATAAAAALTEPSVVLPREVSAERLLKEVHWWLKTPADRRPERWPATVLVVDDEPKLREVLRDFLELHGLKVLTAGSGEEALELLQRAKIVAVLLDVKMPGMDGLMALKKIKAAKPEVSVIMTTGLEEEGAMQEALALGAQDYVTKPYNLEYLETALLSKILLGTD